MLNKIIVIGRTTKDTEIRTTSNGTAVGTFTVAVDRDFKGKNGEKETDFIPVVVWRGLAETCGRYLTKGKMCAVEGRLQIRTYEANDGSKRTIAEIKAESVQFLSPKGENQGNPVSSSFAPNLDELEEQVAPDDIPF